MHTLGFMVMCTRWIFILFRLDYMAVCITTHLEYISQKSTNCCVMVVVVLCGCSLYGLLSVLF